MRTIGLDVEQNGAVRQNLWPLLFTDTEQKRLRETDPCAQDVVATALFAAKEAFYKAQWPITREWLDFQDVEISLNDGAITVSPRSRKAWISPLAVSLSGALASSGNALAAIIFAPST
jgi:4'-phosphopantetheinyl transferase EntD